MFFGLRISKFPSDSVQAAWNAFFGLFLFVVTMCVLFIVSYKLYRENITNYYKCLLPVKDTAFVLAPLLFWLICASIAVFYFTGFVYLYAYIYSDTDGLQKFMIESMMLDNYLVLIVSNIDSFIVSSTYLLLLFFAYTLIKLVVKGKKLRACMMAVILIAFVAIDVLVAKWVVKLVPLIILEEKVVAYQDTVETVSYGLNIAHLLIMTNLCILLIYSTSYLLKIRKDI
jgi:hypothetical protein